MKNRLPVLLTLLYAALSSVSVQAQTAYNIYFGDIHSQTWYSDGNQDQNMATYDVPVAKALTYARDVAHLDFYGVSDHNHNEGGLHMTLGYWRAGNHEADSINQDGVFVGLRGQEWGVISNGGHVLVYGTDKLFGWDAGVYDVYVPKYYYGTLFDSVKKYNGFCYFAHPEATDYKGQPTDANGIFSSPYNASWDSVVTGTALRNGPAFSTNTTETDVSSTDYTPRFYDLLRIGYHVAPIGNQDNHNTNFGLSNQVRTAVLATSLTRANIIDALRNRRVYATTDHNLQLRFESGTHVMGEIFSQTGTISIRIKGYDPDGSGLINKIELFYGVPGSGSAPTVLTSVTNIDSMIYSPSQSVGSTYYYFAHVTETNGRQAWSAPMWITVPTGPVPGSFTQSAPSNSSPNQPISGTLTWQASANATQYDVYLDNNNPPLTLVSQNQATTSYNYSLLNNLTYYWKIVAKNSNGNVVATGAPWSFTTIVASPGPFSLSSPSNSLTNQPISGILMWQSSANAAQYDVYLDTNSTPTTVVSANQNTLTYNYSGLQYTTTYYWNIVAKNVAGNVVATGGPWIFGTQGPPPNSFALASPPPAATGLSLSGSLVWNSSSLATAYDVYMDGNNPPTTLVASNTSDTTFTFQNLTAGQTYYWTAVAKNPNGTTTAGNGPRNFTTLSAPSTPSSASSPNISQTTLQIFWTDNATNEDGYRVYGGLSSSGPFSQLGPDLAPNTVSFQDTGLTIDTRYFYRVAAFNAIGEGAFLPITAATLAAVPGTPSLSNISYTTLTVGIDSSVNAPQTEFAIRVTQNSVSKFVQANGTLGPTQVWQTYASWGGNAGTGVNGLRSCIDVAIDVVARNLDSVQTSFSLPANQTPPCFSLLQNLSDGWNLLSLPISVDDRRKEIVFPQSSSEAFYYQGSYVQRDTLDYGSGFWLKFGSPFSTNLSGDPRMNDSLPLKAGWNIIGSISAPVDVNSLTTQPLSLIASNFFGYNGGYVVADTIQPMQGYWVKSTGQGKMFIASVKQAPSIALKQPGKNNVAEMSSLTIRDNVGHQQTLFMTDNPLDKTAALRYELPPSPPSNAFDVRFSNQRMIAGLGSGERQKDIAIEVKGAVVPITVLWNIVGTNRNTYEISDGTSSEKLESQGSMIFHQQPGQLQLRMMEHTSLDIPKSTALYQNYPNPFNPSTDIRFDLSEESFVHLTVINLLGEQVADLLQEVKSAGQYSLSWTPNVSSGIYFYRIEAISKEHPSMVFRQIRKMMFLK